MDFTPEHLATMRVIADTFAPGDGAAIPSASAVGAPEISLHTAAGGREADARQLAMLLDRWDTPAFGMLLGIGPRRFSTLDRPARERALARLGDSPLALKRGIFSALKTATTLPYMLAVGEPVWQTMGYPGPVGAASGSAPPRLTPQTPSGDVSIETDVVIVGSGAGGGPAAAILAQAGLDVVVLEAGGYLVDGDVDGDEARGLSQLYTSALSAEGQLALFAGRTLGGGTVVNYSTSFRTPDRVREEWAAHGATQFATDEYTRALDAVWARLGVTGTKSTPGARDRVLQRGAEALGWPVVDLQRNVDDTCDEGISCGRCGLGCRLGAKQSTAKTWLADAAAAGARLYTGVNVRRVTRSAGRASGVEGITADGHRVTVRARAVVSSGGSIETPALLQRSGLTNPNIGAHLRLHPATAVLGLMDERIAPWEGTMQARAVEQFTDLDGAGYGAILETAPITPALGSAFINWRSGAQYLERTAEWGSSVDVAVIVRDRDPGGTVRIADDGEPVVRYRISKRDGAHMMTAMVGAARLLEAAGARRIRTTHQRDVVYEPGSGSLARFEADVRRQGVAPGRLGVVALHIMGSARMGGSAAESAVDPDGQSWELPGLYVADASCFPTASGVNPMISIEAISYMTARRLAVTLA